MPALLVRPCEQDDYPTRNLLVRGECYDYLTGDGRWIRARAREEGVWDAEDEVLDGAVTLADREGPTLEYLVARPTDPTVYALVDATFVGSPAIRDGVGNLRFTGLRTPDLPYLARSSEAGPEGHPRSRGRSSSCSRPTSAARTGCSLRTSPGPWWWTKSASHWRGPRFSRTTCRSSICVWNGIRRQGGPNWSPMPWTSRGSCSPASGDAIWTSPRRWRSCSARWGSVSTGHGVPGRGVREPEAGFWIFRAHHLYAQVEIPWGWGGALWTRRRPPSGWPGRGGTGRDLPVGRGPDGHRAGRRRQGPRSRHRSGRPSTGSTGWLPLCCRRRCGRVPSVG